jgi:large subunit ribosomal protein L32
MPNPTHRHSKARRDKRRAHDALKPPGTSVCPDCGEAKLPHRACKHCGSYRGRDVIAVEKT